MPPAFERPLGGWPGGPAARTRNDAKTTEASGASNINSVPLTNHVHALLGGPWRSRFMASWCRARTWLWTPFKPTCHHQHHQHQQHLEGGDGQHRQTRFCSIPSDACRATDLTEQRLHRVGRRCEVFDESKRGETEEKRVGGGDQRCRAEDRSHRCWRRSRFRPAGSKANCSSHAGSSWATTGSTNPTTNERLNHTWATTSATK